MDISVVAASRKDDSPPTEALAVASLADRLGYREAWVGEGPTWDAFVLATAVGLATDRIAVTAGRCPSRFETRPLSRGVPRLWAAVTGRTVGVALGTSSVRVVEGVHGRSRARAAAVLAETAEAVRPLVGEHVEPKDEVFGAHGFRRRLPPARGPLTVAAFGDRAIVVAARYADRMLLDSVCPEQVSRIRARLDAAADDVGRTPPRLAAWLPAAVDPDPRSSRQLRSSIAGYLTVRGYAEMFTVAGSARRWRWPAAGASRDRLIAALPPEAASVVGLVVDAEAVRARVELHAAASLDEVAIVPATSGDPAGERTLTALSEIRSWESGTPGPPERSTRDAIAGTAAMRAPGRG